MWCTIVACMSIKLQLQLCYTFKLATNQKKGIEFRSEKLFRLQNVVGTERRDFVSWCTVPDRSNLTGNALPERLGNAKRNGKGTLRERKRNAKRTQRERQENARNQAFHFQRSWGPQNPVEHSQRWCLEMADDKPYTRRKHSREKEKTNSNKCSFVKFYAILFPEMHSDCFHWPTALRRDQRRSTIEIL